MNKTLNRRRLLKTGAGVIAAAGAQTFIGIPALAAYAAGPAVRRNAFTMTASDPILVGYRRAIHAMRLLAPDDPCSWSYQAAIHGTDVTPVHTAWNTCHIDARYFWSWHRMYLYWFERIVRKYSGMYDWAIPFWDWANPAQRQLPPAFRIVGSELYDATRNSQMNDGTGAIDLSLGTSVTSAFTQLTFYNAQSGINGPHGSVHIAVTGNMCCVTSAAVDPIFWLHHSTVDRQWNLWLAQGGGRSDPLFDADWRTHEFTFFDECCREVKMKGCDVLRAAQQLSYTYECEPPQVEQFCPRIWRPPVFDIEVLVRFRKPFKLTKETVRVPLSTAVADNKAFAPRLTEAAKAPGKTLVLLLKGVEAEQHPGASWQVFVGPAGLTTDSRSPFFVGILGLFGGGIRTRKDHYHPGEFAFPISKALLGTSDPSKLQVIFVPASGVEVQGRPLPAAVRADLTVGEMSIIVDGAMPLPPQDEQDKLREESKAD